MSNKTLPLNNVLYEYILSVSLREPEVLARLRNESLQQSMSMMLSAPEQGQFMALLVQLLGDLVIQCGFVFISPAIKLKIQ